MAKMQKRQTNQSEVLDEVNVEELPKFSILKEQVDEIVSKCSWWDLYGVDWCLIFLFVIVWGIGLGLLTYSVYATNTIGLFLIGWAHSALATKSGHIAGHGGLCATKWARRPLSLFFVEFIGTFSEELAYSAHIKEHHPYTNIIGIGDSSTWKVPFLSRHVYMFLAPIFLPLATPLVSVLGLVEKKSIMGLVSYLLCAGAGLWFQASLLVSVAGFSYAGALLAIWVARAMLSIPYIHVNIFQHIGLPMYAKENKPVRLYQMATGVLNLPSNIILDYAFGHSIMSAHVEHHLFPGLSDNMCLTIKPVVSQFLKSNGLPYNEQTYMNRLFYFLEKYETLMVNAPPITRFVGIQ